MFKDTSLVIIIGLFDLLTTAKTALSDPHWRPFYIEGYLFVAADLLGLLLLHVALQPVHRAPPGRRPAQILRGRHRCPTDTAAAPPPTPGNR